MEWKKPIVVELDISYTFGGSSGSPSETSVIAGFETKYKKANGTLKKAIGKSYAQLEQTNWFRNNDIDEVDKIYMMTNWDSIPENS